MDFWVGKVAEWPETTLQSLRWRQVSRPSLYWWRTATGTCVTSQRFYHRTNDTVFELNLTSGLTWKHFSVGELLAALNEELVPSSSSSGREPEIHAGVLRTDIFKEKQWVKVVWYRASLSVSTLMNRPADSRVKSRVLASSMRTDPRGPVAPKDDSGSEQSGCANHMFCNPEWANPFYFLLRYLNATLHWLTLIRMQTFQDC